MTGLVGYYVISICFLGIVGEQHLFIFFKVYFFFVFLFSLLVGG